MIKMRRSLAVTVFSTALLASCVSKKKYVALEGELDNTKSTLQKTRVEKEEIEEKYAAIEARVADYNAKINSLRSSNDEKLEMNDVTAMSNKTKDRMRKTIAKMDASELEGVETLEDSINAAISYNLKNEITEGKDGDDVDITVDKTVVMINVSDKLLFRSGSYRLSNDAQPLLKKLAEVINSEPSMEVMVEGHTDNRTMVEDSWLEDNWDLSVRRATAVVRQLQDKYDVDGAKLIAAGRSSYSPLVENTSKDNMAKNRRTRIVVIPNLDKFFAMLDSEGEI
ncbi:MAG: cell envelope biogenesis protein OmpA [Zunongwangia sp.]|uniref:OmpA/MotB family outer membrane protein n=4 Tax=Flavobacteriaceae TaxID=49546 RepID=D5BAP3_ZUNPS|nr:OmpA/MotB family outer membrane protein [Zunongwangia profunda SM-A87]MAC65331.1 cell envelope biogenesis protein OmpA [Flavobacteriaceae bacterium]MAO37457.1 cell envelope biogenesis protein OmpA [Zunongwangia sp.]MAS69236.1 cell envelope biogenesis protein OmpA [Zunongwangia sp.]|tara:strand:- start:29 stop:874 length:846 start_codon:yes stop_codon:yes gene_type:complete